MKTKLFSLLTVCSLIFFSLGNAQELLDKPQEPVDASGLIDVLERAGAELLELKAENERLRARMNGAEQGVDLPSLSRAELVLRIRNLEAENERLRQREPEEAAPDPFERTPEELRAILSRTADRELPDLKLEGPAGEREILRGVSNLADNLRKDQPAAADLLDEMVIMYAKNAKLWAAAFRSMLDDNVETRERCREMITHLYGAEHAKKARD